MKLLFIWEMMREVSICINLFHQKNIIKNGDNSKVLEDGDLFVAKFDDNGKGKWLPLTPENNWNEV